MHWGETCFSAYNLWQNFNFPESTKGHTRVERNIFFISRHNNIKAKFGTAKQMPLFDFHFTFILESSLFLFAHHSEVLSTLMLLTLWFIMLPNSSIKLHWNSSVRSITIPADCKRKKKEKKKKRDYVNTQTSPQNWVSGAVGNRISTANLSFFSTELYSCFCTWALQYN